MKCVQQRLPHFMSLISIAQKKPWLHAQEPCNCNYGFLDLRYRQRFPQEYFAIWYRPCIHFPLFIFTEGVSSQYMYLLIASVFDHDPVEAALWHIKYVCTVSSYLTYNTTVGRIH